VALEPPAAASWTGSHPQGLPQNDGSTGLMWTGGGAGRGGLCLEEGLGAVDHKFKRGFLGSQFAGQNVSLSLTFWLLPGGRTKMSRWLRLGWPSVLPQQPGRKSLEVWGGIHSPSCYVLLLLRTHDGADIFWGL
jgi:hypothetical protein